MFKWALSCIALAGGAAEARAVAAEPVMIRVPAADVVTTRFLDALKAGKTEGVVEALLASSPLWQNKTLEVQNMRTQITGAIQAYGPIASYELVESKPIGSSAIRQYYLVRQAKMVTRWEFDLVRLQNDWTVTYFGFDDQVRNWF